MRNYSFFSSQKVRPSSQEFLFSILVCLSCRRLLFSACEALASASGCFLSPLFELVEKRAFTAEMIRCNHRLFHCCCQRSSRKGDVCSPACICLALPDAEAKEDAITEVIHGGAETCGYHRS